MEKSVYHIGKKNKVIYIRISII